MLVRSVQVVGPASDTWKDTPTRCLSMQADYALRRGDAMELWPRPRPRAGRASILPRPAPRDCGIIPDDALGAPPASLHPPPPSAAGDHHTLGPRRGGVLAQAPHAGQHDPLRRQPCESAV